RALGCRVGMDFRGRALGRRRRHSHCRLRLVRIGVRRGRAAVAGGHRAVRQAATALFLRQQGLARGALCTKLRQDRRPGARLMNLPRVLIALCMALASSGCALEQKLREIALSAEATHAEVAHQRQVFADRVGNADKRRASQHVDRPWLAGRAQPLARDVSLPPALRARTTLVFAGAALDLPAIAQRITQATGIPVHVRPDALLPRERFAPRLAGGAGLSQPAAAPTTMHLAGAPAPLSSLLDRIAAALGVRWRYADQRIEFYRTETRMFNVRALTLNADAEAALGSAADTTEHGFSSASKTRLTGGKVSLMEVVRQRIEPF